jgi:hypothetical protein
VVQSTADIDVCMEHINKKIIRKVQMFSAITQHSDLNLMRLPEAPFYKLAGNKEKNLKLALTDATCVWIQIIFILKCPV